MKMRVLLCFSALVLLTGCDLLQQQDGDGEKEQQDEKVVIPPPLHLGAVHQVYPEQGFALLRMLGPVPPAGTTLITHPADGSNDRVGNLCVSAAGGSRNNMIAADIRSGTVVQGDRVFLYRDIAAPEAQEQVVTEEATEETTTDDTIPEQEEPAAPEMPTADETPAAVDTTVLPEGETPAIPEPTAPDTVPASIQDVPDTIDDWNNY
ncbi:MAG: hypothetical protein MJ051_00470 [Akkermansia sp.]|nr:hypothetical protein [Akkermansia sp.]